MTENSHTTVQMSKKLHEQLKTYSKNKHIKIIEAVDTIISDFLNNTLKDDGVRGYQIPLPDQPIRPQVKTLIRTNDGVTRGTKVVVLRSPENPPGPVEQMSAAAGLRDPDLRDITEPPVTINTKQIATNIDEQIKAHQDLMSKF